ncbi:MAG: hypothetical protein R3E50_09895 [Halioglobus sp.]
MLTSKRPWIIALAVGLYLYYLLPATANLFFELYHLTHIDPIYWGYSGFKIAGYYLGTYEHRSLACVGAAAMVLVVAAVVTKLRRA